MITTMTAMASTKNIVKILFESAKKYGLATLYSGKESIVVVSENRLPLYRRYQDSLEMRKCKINEESCFILIFRTKDGDKPGYLFYDNGVVTFEENWIEENYYWDNSIRRHLVRLTRQKDAQIYVKKHE